MPRLCPPLPFHRPSEPSEFLLGRLVLPTGQLVACDPLSGLSAASAFERSVPPGIYAVRLGALGGDAAYVALLCGEGVVVHWEAALCQGQHAPLALEAAPGFDVAQRTAAYFDVAGLSPLRRLALRPQPQRDLPVLLREAGYDERPHAVVDLGGAGNLVAFGTGLHGRFSSYWGLDENGRPVVLVTDLGVLRGAQRVGGGAKILPFVRPVRPKG